MTTKVSIISGFLGAGKTTYLKKVLPFMEGKIAIIENEFGQIGIDGELLKGDMPIREIFAGCICCSVAGDFKTAISELINEYNPDHIVIEPSGVGNLSEIIKVIELIRDKGNQPIDIQHLITIVDASGFDEYIEDFGMFYSDQIRNAQLIILSHTDSLENSKTQEVINRVRDINSNAYIIGDDWSSIAGDILYDMVRTSISEGTLSEDNIKTVSADKVFGSVSIMPKKAVLESEVLRLLDELKSCKSGKILRAKGVFDLIEGGQLRFNYTPFSSEIEKTDGYYAPKAVIIGAKIDKNEIKDIFSIYS